MGYVLPKGSSKIGTAYAFKASKADRKKGKHHDPTAEVRLPEPVKIPPPVRPAASNQ